MPKASGAVTPDECQPSQQPSFRHHDEEKEESEDRAENQVVKAKKRGMV